LLDKWHEQLGGIILERREDKKEAQGWWHPQADDVLADDWELVD
jgi:hypothetical protein